jgi:glycine/D-amino acid oxidase-like deaminating enzyme
VYGATIAVELARAGHEVDLYERHRDLLHGATRGQLGRLHLGYHYPRSLETALAAKADAARFAARFPGAVNRRNSHYFTIASEGSLTTADEFLAFCEQLDAGARVTGPLSLLAGVDVCVRAPEAIVNVVALREQLRTEVRTSRVRFHRDANIDPGRLDHDLIIMATYGRGWPEPLQWEVCEVAVLSGTWPYAYKSVVVLDGPQGCGLDPLPTKAGHLLYHVTDSVHATNTGLAPEIPEHLASLLDRGPVVTPHSRREVMLQAARQFFPSLGEVTSPGSMFTVRAVLRSVDATDARPTVVRRDGRMVWVLSGKVNGAVVAAAQVVTLAGDQVAA